MLTGRPLQEIDKLAAKDAAEDLDGEEEGIFGMNPAGIAWFETAGGNDAVEMRMQSQVLPPGMQNAEEADLGSEVLGVGRNFKHGLSAGAFTFFPVIAAGWLRSVSAAATDEDTWRWFPGLHGRAEPGSSAGPFPPRANA